MSWNPSLGFALEGKLKRCFESDDPSIQVFDPALLFGERGVELVNLIAQFQRVGERVPYTFCQSHDQLFLFDFCKVSIRASDSATRERVFSMARIVLLVPRMTCFAM